MVDERPHCGSSLESRPADRLGENKYALPDARRRFCRAAQEPFHLGRRLVAMTLMSFLCSCFRGRAEPPKPETAPTTGADLGQNAAKNEALSKEQLRHMEGGEAAKSAQEQKVRKRP